MPRRSSLLINRQPLKQILTHPCQFLTLLSDDICHSRSTCARAARRGYSERKDETIQGTFLLV